MQEEMVNLFHQAVEITVRLLAHTREHVVDSLFDSDYCEYFQRRCREALV